jgi:hypothetical protein
MVESFPYPVHPMGTFLLHMDLHSPDEPYNFLRGPIKNSNMEEFGRRGAWRGFDFCSKVFITKAGFCSFNRLVSELRKIIRTLISSFMPGRI